MAENNKNALCLDDVEIFLNERCPNGAIRLSWSGNMGFGQYDIIINDDKTISARTECMDSNDDKDFTKQLFKLLIDKINIEE